MLSAFVKASMKKYTDTVKPVHQLVEPNQDQLASFLKESTELLGIQFPKEYVERSTVLTLVDQQQLVCGGAIVVTEPPYRSLGAIPPNQQNEAWEELNSTEHVVEVNGVWLAHELRSPYLSFSFWRHLITYLLSTDQKQFIFTFDNSNDRMMDVAKWLKPNVLYSGRTLKLEGMKSESDETIAWVDHESIKVVLELLERRGMGTPGAEEVEFISRIEKRSCAS